MRPKPPVFQDAYDLTLELYRLVPSFPKAQRFVLGQRIEQASLTVLFGVEAAGQKQGRAVALRQASDGLDQVRLLLRLAKDLGFLSLDRHEALILRCDGIGRQLVGWTKADGESPPC